MAPYWFRLCQCLRRYGDTGERLPHLANAFKYLWSMSITAFAVLDESATGRGAAWGTVRTLFVLSYMGSTLYSWAWDVLVDWAALDVNAAAHLAARETHRLRTAWARLVRYFSGKQGGGEGVEKGGGRGEGSGSGSAGEEEGGSGSGGGGGGMSESLLRSRRMIRPAWCYCTAILVDLVLRFVWTYTLIPAPHRDDVHFDKDFALYIAPFAATAEILRRCMWSVFRLENEHLNNTARYRKVTYIPLHFDAPTSDRREAVSDRRGRVMAEAGIFVVVAAAVLVLASVTSD